MELYITLTVCFLPLIFAVVFAVLKVEGFKWSYVLGALAIGFGAIVVIIVVQTTVLSVNLFSVNSLRGVFVSALVLNGLIEESIKMVFLFFLPGKKMTCKVFFTVALLVGCAVGSLETVFYALNGSSDTVLRFFTAVVLHILTTGLSGLFVWSAKNGKIRISIFLTALFSHGIYNFFAGFTGIWWWFSIITILFVFVRCRVYYLDLREKN